LAAAQQPLLLAIVGMVTVAKANLLHPLDLGAVHPR